MITNGALGADYKDPNQSKFFTVPGIMHVCEWLYVSGVQSAYAAACEWSDCIDTFRLSELVDWVVTLVWRLLFG